MSHIRRQIRDAVALLLTGLPLTGANVFVSRASPLAPSELPALRVSITNSQLQQLSLLGTGGAQTDLTLAIDIEVKAADGCDDLIDDIAEDVEGALLLAPSATWLGGFVDGVETSIEFDEETNLPAGRARLSVAITTFA